MIGVVVVAHGELAEKLVETTQAITGQRKNLAAVSVDAGEDPQGAIQAIKDAIRRVDDGDGVILLTDLFGGTPSNLCLSFLDRKNIEVISGVNLPMLIKLASFAEKSDLREIAKQIMEYGKQNISVASRRLYNEDT
jgi:PTS system mannose-specific IIA component